MTPPEKKPWQRTPPDKQLWQSTPPESILGFRRHQSRITNNQYSNNNNRIYDVLQQQATTKNRNRTHKKRKICKSDSCNSKQHSEDIIFERRAASLSPTSIGNNKPAANIHQQSMQLYQKNTDKQHELLDSFATHTKESPLYWEDKYRSGSFNISSQMLPRCYYKTIYPGIYHRDDMWHNSHDIVLPMVKKGTFSVASSMIIKQTRSTNIMDLIYMREKAINDLDSKGYRVDIFDRLLVDGRTMNEQIYIIERKFEENRIRSGQSIVSCCYPGCTKLHAFDVKGKSNKRVCTIHNRLLLGVGSYDIALALKIQAIGIGIEKVDARLELPGPASCSHAPDATLERVDYPQADENGKNGHLVVIANDGKMHDGYKVTAEFNNLKCEYTMRSFSFSSICLLTLCSLHTAMIDTAKKAGYHIVVIRHTYPNGTLSPGTQKMKMLESLCKQLGKNARPNSSIVVYDYKNKHTAKAEKEYKHDAKVNVISVDLNDESSKCSVLMNMNVF